MKKDLLFTEANVERLYRAMDNDFQHESLGSGDYAVKREKFDDETDGHIVDTENWTCSCPDYQYNIGEGEMCKHCWFMLLERAGLS